MLEFLRSSTRPIVTYMFAGASVAGFLMGIIPSDKFMDVAQMILLFWFAQRGTEKVVDRVTPPPPAALRDELPPRTRGA